MVAGQIFDDDLVVIDKGILPVVLDRQSFRIGWISQNQTGTSLMFFTEKCDDCGSGALEFDSSDIKVFSQPRKVAEQSFQDRTFRSE